MPAVLGALVFSAPRSQLRSATWRRPAGALLGQCTAPAATKFVLCSELCCDALCSRNAKARANHAAADCTLKKVPLINSSVSLARFPVCGLPLFMGGFRSALAHAMQCLRRNVSRSRTFACEHVSRICVQCRAAADVYYMQGVRMSKVPNPRPAPRFARLPLTQSTACGDTGVRLILPFLRSTVSSPFYQFDITLARRVGWRRRV